MWPDCDCCPYWFQCFGNTYYCPIMFGDGHPDDFGDN